MRIRLAWFIRGIANAIDPDLATVNGLKLPKKAAEWIVREQLRKNVEEGKDKEIKSLKLLEEQKRAASSQL